MEKITKREMFEQIKSHLTNEAEIAFIDHELELLAKKNSYKSTKPTKTQVANVALKDRIAQVMGASEAPMTASEILKALADDTLSGSKVTAMLTQMKNDGVVVRTEEKRKAYFSLA
jgi:Fe2+ or Zn2+ uptake regulation protein